MTGQAGAQVETSETVRLAPLIVPRADGEIVMDGRIDERAWSFTVTAIMGSWLPMQSSGFKSSRSGVSRVA